MDIKGIVKELENIAQQVACAVRQWCKSTYVKSRQTQVQIQTAKQTQYLNRMLFDIQSELFNVMQGGHYSILCPILDPKNIRIETVERIGRSFVFCYKVSLQNNKTILPVILDNLKSNINADIYQYQQTVLYNDGFQLASFNHPYIISGLYVTDIQSLATDIIIKVVTNYFPYTQ